MKPIIIIPPDVMSPEDIELMRKNDICVVVASDPSKVKFIDPIPAQSSRTEIENAAIKLSRKILNRGIYDDGTRGNFARMYVEMLVKGTPLDADGTAEEQEKQIYDSAKRDEISKLAREDARNEREAKKLKK